MTPESDVGGELVVLNGKKRGTELKLRLPITLIGCSDRCDIRISGPGISEVHAIITHTAVGPVLRALQPDQTLVNGVIISTRVLKSRDEITVGPCVFRFEWHEEELVSLRTAPPPEGEFATLWVAPTDAEWNLIERAEALHAQEEYIANLYRERSERLQQIVQELAGRREEIRQFKSHELAQVRDAHHQAELKKGEAEQASAQAEADRLRARTLYSRFLKRLKSQRHEQQAELKQQREELTRIQEKLEREAADLQRHQVNLKDETFAQQARIRQAWELLAEGQRRLLTDRQAAEDMLGLQKQALDSREAELAYQQGVAVQGQTRVEARVQELLSEIQRLEQRAGMARHVVQKLEDQRSQLEASLSNANSSTALLAIHPITDVVPLNASQDRGVEDLLKSLAHQERDVSRERQALAVVRDELAKQAIDLQDQRAVVAEQVAELLLARESWQSAQLLALEELEVLARSFDDREQMLEQRVNEYHLLDQARRRREDDLHELRNKLEAWQLQLTTHEADLIAARTAMEEELAAKRHHLQEWEAALIQLRDNCDSRYKLAIEPLTQEAQKWAEAREELAHQKAMLASVQGKYLQEAVRVGQLALAVEQTQQELFGSAVGKLAERRLRVFQKYWEKHFEQAYQHLQQQQGQLENQAEAVAARHAKLAAAQLDFSQHQQQLLKMEQELEHRKFCQVREQDEAAKVLSLARARAERSEQQLKRLAEEVNQHATKLTQQTYTPLPGWGKAA